MGPSRHTHQRKSGILETCSWKAQEAGPSTCQRTSMLMVFEICRRRACQGSASQLLGVRRSPNSPRKGPAQHPQARPGLLVYPPFPKHTLLPGPERQSPRGAQGTRCPREVRRGRGCAQRREGDL